jgi:FkbM family methyltransferase
MEGLRFALRERLLKSVVVRDGPHTYRFRCGTPLETWRARTLFVKEEGTIRWLRRTLRESEVFYDVGANVGLYTILASRLVGKTGQVVAFEPHVGNVESLLHNLRENDAAANVRVISAALNDVEGYFDFHYRSALPGSAISQLHHARDDFDRPFTPVFTEYKWATTIDRLVSDGVIRPACHVKIDVDGNELRVLRGMSAVLKSAERPRTVQVEVNVPTRLEISRFMTAHGYAAVERHYTQGGRAHVEAGGDPEAIGYNVIFEGMG